MARNKSFLPAHAYIFLLLLVLFSVLYLALFVFRSFSNSSYINEVQTKAPTGYIGEDSLPIFDIDTSEWKIYSDAEVGLSFKYPAEWGEPIRSLESCNSQTCSSDENQAWQYRVTFPSSDFSVGGASANWTPSRGVNLLFDYRGFDNNGDNQYAKQEFCETPWFIECNIGENVIQYTSSLACRGESGSGFSYERVMLLDVPNNSKINGLAFGGSFVSEDSELLSCDEVIRDSVTKALISRRLSTEIMREYDLYNEVFETVEVY